MSWIIRFLSSDIVIPFRVWGPKNSSHNGRKSKGITPDSFGAQPPPSPHNPPSPLPPSRGEAASSNSLKSFDLRTCVETKIPNFQKNRKNVAFCSMLTPRRAGEFCTQLGARQRRLTPHASRLTSHASRSTPHVPRPTSQEVGRGMAALQQLEHPISDDTARMFSGMGVPQAGPPVVGAGGDDRPHGVNKLCGVLGNVEEM